MRKRRSRGLETCEPGSRASPRKPTTRLACWSSEEPNCWGASSTPPARRMNVSSASTQPLLPATEVDFGLAHGVLGEIEEEESGHPDIAARHFEKAIAALGTSEAREPLALVGYLSRLAALQREGGNARTAARTLERAIGVSGRFPGMPSEPGLDAVGMYQELARSGAAKFLSSQKLNRWRGGTTEGPMLASASAPTLAKASSPGARWGRCALQRGGGERRRQERLLGERRPGDCRNASELSGLLQRRAEERCGFGGVDSVRGQDWPHRRGSRGARRRPGAISRHGPCAGEHVLRANFGPTDPGGATVVIPVTFEVDQSFHLARLPF